MIIPSRLWFVVAAALALVAPLALVRPAAATILLTLDAVWLALLLIDVFRAAGEDLGAIMVTRTAPPAFSLGNRVRVEYRWQNGLRRKLNIEVREEAPDTLGLEHSARTILLGGRGVTFEEMDVMPLARGKANTERST